MRRRLLHLGALTLLGTSCAPGESEGQTGFVVGFGEPTVVVSTASGSIGLLSDMAVLPDGVLIAADVISSRVLRVQPDGSVETFGRSGEGPGEFQAPSAVGVIHPDTIAVWDSRGGRVQVFGPTGTYGRSFPTAVPEGVSPAWNTRGWLAAPTLGTADGLVQVLDPSGNGTSVVGELLAPGSAIIDFSAALGDIRRGVIPAFTRNAVRVAWASPESVWILPESEPRVMRMGLDGRLIQEAPIEDRALTAIRQGYFDSAVGAASSGGVRPFRYYADVEPVGDEVWALVSHEEAKESVILVISTDGSVNRRIPLPFNGRLGAFAVDLRRGLLFAADVDQAQLLSFPLVDGV